MHLKGAHEIPVYNLVGVINGNADGTVFGAKPITPVDPGQSLQARLQPDVRSEPKASAGAYTWAYRKATNPGPLPRLCCLHRLPKAADIAIRASWTVPHITTQDAGVDKAIFHPMHARLHAHLSTPRAPPTLLSCFQTLTLPSQSTVHTSPPSDVPSPPNALTCARKPGWSVQARVLKACVQHRLLCGTSCSTASVCAGGEAAGRLLDGYRGGAAVELAVCQLVAHQMATHSCHMLAAPMQPCGKAGCQKSGRRATSAGKVYRTCRCGT